MAMYADVDVTSATVKLQEKGDNLKWCASCKKQVPIKEVVVVQQFRFTCGYCRYSSCKSRESFWFHLFGHDLTAKKSSVHPCPMCLKEFVNKTSLQNHVLTHKEQLYSECPTCQLRFIDKGNFQHHVKVFHAAAAGESVLSFLKQHKLRMTATPMCKACQIKHGHRCDVCYAEATNFERLAAHREKSHVKCPDCQRFIVKKDDLERHMASDHNPANPHVCATCKKCFAKLAELKTHSSVHAQKPSPAQTVLPVSEGGMKCTVCKERFKEKAQLKNHIERMHFFCPLCNLVFKVGTKFSKHVQVSHSYWPVSCKFCKERCWKMFELRRHLRNQHNADYDVVGLGYHERSAKYDDEEVVVEEAVSNGQNSAGTPSVSASPASLNNSNSPATSGSVAPADDVECEIVELSKSYKCFYCRSEYPKVANLMAHIRNYHQRNSPYHCSICNDSMWEDYVFHLHCIKHEKELPKVIIVGNVISQLPANYDLGESNKNDSGTMDGDAEDPELSYRCPYCTTKFLRMQHINAHVKETHTGEAPYRCNICSHLLWELVEFEAHFRKHNTADATDPAVVVVNNHIKLKSEGQEDDRRRAIEAKLESLLEKILSSPLQRGVGLRQRGVRDILCDLLTAGDEKLTADCEVNSSTPLVVLERTFKSLLHQIPTNDDDVDDSWIDQMSFAGLVADMDTVLQADPLSSSK